VVHSWEPCFPEIFISIIFVCHFTYILQQFTKRTIDVYYNKTIVPSYSGCCTSMLKGWSWEETRFYTGSSYQHSRYRALSKFQQKTFLSNALNWARKRLHVRWKIQLHVLIMRPRLNKVVVTELTSEMVFLSHK